MIFKVPSNPNHSMILRFYVYVDVREDSSLALFTLDLNPSVEYRQASL